eukprot:2092679-Lingulodinium_polyedra.AAC.1
MGAGPPALTSAAPSATHGRPGLSISFSGAPPSRQHGVPWPATPGSKGPLSSRASRPLSSRASFTRSPSSTARSSAHPPCTG